MTFRQINYTDNNLTIFYVHSSLMEWNALPLGIRVQSKRLKHSVAIVFRFIELCHLYEKLIESDFISMNLY